jgi:hypothetical protein
MKKFVGSLLILMLSGCGGGGGGSTTTVNSYSPSIPTLGAQRILNVVVVDNSDNTINMPGSVRTTVIAVNSDGSFTYRQDDPTNSSGTVNGMDYHIKLADITTNSSYQTSSVTWIANGSTCTFSPHRGGPTYPVSIGSTWSATWTETCGLGAPITFTETGRVGEVESVVVPAGTFAALHFSSTTVSTDAAGTTRTVTTESYKRANDLMPVKSKSTYAYSGVMPANGYPITVSHELQSYQ